MKNIYLYVFGGIAALWAYSYFKLAKSLEVVFKGLKVGGGILTPYVDITLGIQNPSNNSAVLEGISGSVYINEKFLANYSNFTRQKINAKGESNITVRAKPNLLGTITIIKDFIKNKGKGEVEIKVTGTANIDGTSLNFEQKTKV